ncbi:MAG: hypothetical protein R2685_12020 [Candidatus Nitrosocosmicus sp.]|nr:hypothetical protein [Candidatus Nitrosocosmicus sp.]
MSTVSVDEETKKRVIQRRKEGVNMRNVAKEFHLSFTTIKKIWDEREGQTETKPEKSITSRAFFLFEQNKSLVDVTLELDLKPTEAESIHQDYLRLKGLDGIVSYSQKVKKHISSFLDFVTACEEYTPESQKLVDVFNLQKVIKGLEEERLGISMNIECLKRNTSKLKQEEALTKQNLEKLKQEEYNRWYALFGN